MVCKSLLESRAAGGRGLRVLIVLSCAALMLCAVPAQAGDLQGLALLSWTPEKPRQGQVMHFRARAAVGWVVTDMRFLGKSLPLFTLEEPQAEWQALCGVDAQLEPGEYELQVQLKDPGGRTEGLVRTAKLEVLPGGFAEEHLELPTPMVDLSAENLERVRKERARLDSLWPAETPERFWQGAFLIPVEGRTGTAFGVRRWINGMPRSLHSGMDIAAPEGTPVRAANSGRAVMVADRFFEGKSVFLDHGGGLYTMYFHLSRVRLREGDLVSRGEILGWVGSTGRGTGPHLHWGVRLGGARVDPLALVERTSVFP